MSARTDLAFEAALDDALPIACIVLPTYNEVDNIGTIIPAIFAEQERIFSHNLHVLVVDDNSPDGTPDKVRQMQQDYPHLHLISGKKNGLGEAYKRGMAHAIEKLDPDLLLEMDADGQHDPALLPIFVMLSDNGYSLVIGSRFAAGGSTPDFSLRRKAISLIGNWMIRVFGGVPRIRDCTSGYRCIKASLIPLCNFEFLSTRGYSFQSSLLCELLRNGARPIEVPIIFPDREHGQSKLTMQDQLEFLANIARIRFRHSEEFIKFCAVGFSGVFINLGVYLLLTRIVGVPLELASPVAIESSILTNFALNHLWTFSARNTGRSLWYKLTRFHMAAGVAGLFNYGVFLTLLRGLGVYDVVANLIGIGCATLINYFLNSLWTWQEAQAEPDPVACSTAIATESTGPSDRC